MAQHKKTFSQRRARSSLLKYFALFTGVERVHFQKELINKSVEGEQVNLPLQLNWLSRLPVTLSDVSWLVHDYGEAGIHLKARAYADCDCTEQWYSVNSSHESSPTQHSHWHQSLRRRHTDVYSRDDLTYNSTPVKTTSHHQHQQASCRCRLYKDVTTHRHTCNRPGGKPCASLPESGYQTPAESSSGGSTGGHTPAVGDDNDKQTPDLAAMKKISDLEMELMRLKQQLAVLVVSQEQMVKNQWKPGESLQLNDRVDMNTPTTSMPPPPPPPPGCVPPPPPPPPPPLFDSKHQKSITEIINETKLKRGQSVTSSVPSRKGPDLTEVLKGLGTVKLRSIARSPGGTPLRERPRSAEKNDPAALIARALKRKFSHRQTTNSPDAKTMKGKHGERVRDHKAASPGGAGGDGNTSADSSWSNTPPGQYLLKPTKTKVKLLE